MPQVLEGMVEVVTVFPRERKQQRTAEQIEDVPRFPEETVEAMKLVQRAPSKWWMCLSFLKRPSRW